MQSEEIHSLLEKWEDCRRTIDMMEKKIKRYRQTVEQYLEKNNLSEFENERFKVKRNIQQRSLLTKKMVPKEVWEMYSLPQRVEFITLTEKKKSLKKKVS